MKTDVSTKRSLLHVPLARLKFGHERPGAGINARAPNGGAGIPELANSIRRLGIVVPLIIQASPNDCDSGDAYVADGNRRLEALRKIASEGGPETVGALNLKAIPCVVGVGDGLELSLVANIDRLPLHPVDKCEAFAILIDQGASVADVAARFSIRPREVEQALAIRALAPEVRAAWRAGEIKAEDAQAFTIEPDQKRQAKVFRELKKANDLWPAEIRSQLVGDRANAGPMLALVGAEAYEAAGGRVMRDLFRDQHAVSDAALLKRLVDEKVAGECARLVADGWKWAMPADAPEAKNRYSWSRLREDGKPTKDEKARLKALEAVVTAIDDADAEDPDDYERREAATDEIETINQAITLRAFTPEQKKRAGCLVGVRDNGTLEIVAGLVIPAAKAEAAVAKAKGEAPSPADKKKAAAARERKATAGEVSKALDERLTVQLRKATRRALKLAAADYGKPTLLESILANLAADLVRPEERWHRPIPDTVEDAIRGAISRPLMLDSLLKEFDAKDYFASIPRANKLAIVQEAFKDRARADSCTKLNSAELTKWCTTCVPETGWLPVQLRGPWYDAKAKPKAKKRR